MTIKKSISGIAFCVGIIYSGVLLFLPIYQAIKSSESYDNVSFGSLWLQNQDPPATILLIYALCITVFSFVYYIKANIHSSIFKDIWFGVISGGVVPFVFALVMFGKELLLKGERIDELYWWIWGQMYVGFLVLPLISIGIVTAILIGWKQRRKQ